MNDKNNPKLAVLIAILILLQGISIIKMNGLQRQVAITNEQIQYINDKVSQEMSVVYANIERILGQQASSIESALTELGSVNKEELIVPITFTLTPKEVSENTMVYLDLAGELFPMTKDGITFTSTITRDVFASALPRVVIEEEGIKKIMQDNQVGIGSIKELVFPTMMPRLSGSGRFRGGTYSRKGKFSADIKESPSGIEFGKIPLLVMEQPCNGAGEIVGDNLCPKRR